MACVGFVGIAVSNLLTTSSKESRETRAANIAAAEAQLVMERIIGLAGASRLHKGLTPFCEALVANGGPLAGGTVTGACPDFSVTNITLQTAKTFKVDGRIAPQAVGTTDGYLVEISIKSPTTQTVKIRTLLGSI